MDAKTFEAAVVKKIAWRILPLILLSYCIAYIDRANIAVAALTMNKDLGFSAFTYGLGAGIFFLGYFIFEVPSNLILERVGARRWIARIMFTWGILSAACAFVTGPTSFIVVRFLLGVAEAGFFPGVVLYFTYWFPDRFRGRILAMLYLAIPIANALSNLVSGAILDGMNGLLGLRGWQWVFIIEAAPAVLLSFIVFRALIDRPSLATWLEPDERQWLEKELNDERSKAEGQGRLTLGEALRDPRVVALSMIYLLSVTAGYGMTFFLPQIVKGLGLSNFMTGVASAIPYLVGMIALLIWGWSSDRTGERWWHPALAAAASGHCAAEAQTVRAGGSDCTPAGQARGRRSRHFAGGFASISNGLTCFITVHRASVTRCPASGGAPFLTGRFRHSTSGRMIFAEAARSA
jgi:MFS transporter, ACS family, tartrate transporter